MESKRVVSWIEDHREDLVEFVLEFGSVSSPRGHEQEASEFLADWFRRHGFKYRTQPVVGDRSNVVGTIAGTEDRADSVVFNGHIDTAFGNPDEDANVLSSQGRFHRDVWRDGDVLFGDDVVNDKGQIAAFLWAGRAMREAGVKPPGDVHLAGVVGEISGATVGEFQDPQYVGTGVGTRHLVDGGITGDYALVAETTDFAIARAECGVAWFEITIRGDATYQPRLVLDESAEVPGDHPGALPHAAKAVLKLESWANSYSEAHTQTTETETVRPSAGVGAVRSGNPQAPAVTPGIAKIYLDVRLPPGEGPEFVRDDLSDVLADCPGEVDIDQYLYRRGYFADEAAVSPLLDRTMHAYEEIRDDEPPRPATEITSMWRDVNVFNEVGIPAITFGPPRTTTTVDSETAQGLRIDDIVDAAKMYALVALGGDPSP